MQLGNFNITFGKTDEPMLRHFKDVIYPAMTSGIERGNREKKETIFLFKNVELKKDANDEYILTGNIIKDSDYEITSKLIDGELVEVREIHPEAPYSRFIVFLKNHRMLLVRDGKGSPDLRSFARTLRSIVFLYIGRENKIRKDERKPLLPYASINIVGIPLDTTVQKALEVVSSIQKLEFLTFPLNGDNSFVSAVRTVQDTGKKIDSRRQRVTFSSPKSKMDTAEVITQAMPVAEVRLDVTYKDHSKGIIREDKLTENLRVNISKGLKDGEEDADLIAVAKEYKAMKYVSDENKALYDKLKDELEKMRR